MVKELKIMPGETYQFIDNNGNLRSWVCISAVPSRVNHLEANYFGLTTEPIELEIFPNGMNRIPIIDSDIGALYWCGKYIGFHEIPYVEKKGKILSNLNMALIQPIIEKCKYQQHLELMNNKPLDFVKKCGMPPGTVIDLDTDDDYEHISFIVMDYLPKDYYPGYKYYYSNGEVVKAIMKRSDLLNHDVLGALRLEPFCYIKSLYDAKASYIIIGDINRYINKREYQITESDYGNETKS